MFRDLPAAARHSRGPELATRRPIGFAVTPCSHNHGSESTLAAANWRSESHPVSEKNLATGWRRLLAELRPRACLALWTRVDYFHSTQSSPQEQF